MCMTALYNDRVEGVLTLLWSLLATQAVAMMRLIIVVSTSWLYISLAGRAPTAPLSEED